MKEYTPINNKPALKLPNPNWYTIGSIIYSIGIPLLFIGLPFMLIGSIIMLINQPKSLTNNKPI